ncbi:TPA: acylphosphatase [Candidatus Uhrbacteria bacterium]|nr:acylphosphatase [Candidatus Uhrbacteria bacterium]
MKTSALHVRIEGRVQGVGYRNSLKDMAVKLGIRGWVRNRGDGSVEVHMVGNTEALQSLLAWCQNGSPLASVSTIHATELDDVPNYSAFSLLT